MNLSLMSLAKMEKTSRVALKNPYTDEPLVDGKGKHLALNVYHTQAKETIERVRDFKRVYEDKSPTDAQFLAMMIDSIEGDMESDSVKLSPAMFKDVIKNIDEIAKFLEEADFVGVQVIEVASKLGNFAPKTLLN
jgi:hypothetical protein